MTNQTPARPDSNPARYTRVAILLHWSIAALILFNMGTGYFMEGWPMPIRSVALMLHASSGLTVLLLTVLRIVWRLLHEPPAHSSSLKPWERHTAHVAHFLLYAAMVLMPISGWAILSAHAPPGSSGAVAEWAAHPGPAPKAATMPAGMPGRPMGPPPPLKYWGVTVMPMIAPIQAIGVEPEGVPALHELHEKFVDWHSVGSFLLLGLFLLHVAGALKHQILDRQPSLERMGAGRRKIR